MDASFRVGSSHGEEQFGGLSGASTWVQGVGAEPGSGGCTAKELGSALQQENKTVLLTVGAI